MTRPGSILVVDDHPVNRELVVYLLALQGHDVETAEDGASALEAIARRMPELLLLDLQLPDVNGLEIARQLRADPRAARLGIIAITSFAMTGDRERCLAAGCDDYVAKPVDTRAFPALVEATLAKLRAR